jgi:spoIIIJ-associated protein
MDRQHDVEELTLTFIRAMNLTLTPTFTEEEDCVRVDLTGPDAYLLIERKGSVLEALQLLMTKVAEVQLGLEKRLVVDCNGFRRGREQGIVENALRAADKVRKLGQPIELAPMNSYERRLVHLALKDEQGISSESRGEGFTKTILISPL